MADLLSSPLLQPPFIYIIFAGIGILFIFLIILKFKSKGEKVDHYKGETLECILTKHNFDKYMKTFGRKLKKGNLYWSMGKVKVRKIVLLSVVIEKIGTKDKKQKQRPEYDKDKKFIVFQSGSFWSNIPIINKISQKSYFVIDNYDEFIKKDEYEDKWVINKNVHLHLMGGVWVCSLAGTSYLSELVYKRLYENDKEVETNTPKRFVWYNDIYASKLTRDVLTSELETAKYDQQREKETGIRRR